MWCQDAKTQAITKIFGCAENTDLLKPDGKEL